MKSRPEYEANTYAAHLLLDGEEVYSLAMDGYDLVQIAQEVEDIRTCIHAQGVKKSYRRNGKTGRLPHPPNAGMGCGRSTLWFRSIESVLRFIPHKHLS